MENLSEEQTTLIRHWSMYGQRGVTPKHRVTPEEWRHFPFSKPETTSWHVPIAPDQLPLLLLGFKPRQSNTSPGGGLFWRGVLQAGDTIKMHIFHSVSQNPDMHASEDKWFVYSEGPDHAQEVRLHMHRSWSGVKSMELRIDAGFDGRGSDGKGPRITAITWETDPEKAGKDISAATAKDVVREVCSWVLNVDLGPGEGALSSSAEVVLPSSNDMMRPTADGLSSAMVPLPEGTTAYRRL
ncbi:hypothetical protein VTJ49DRAFT_4622 [Mycothermus thermophilus]|uniref:Uncharacterized protein n=1 Tax=Humicola insolens TaxID=85995 RepID=A0ABR3V5X5_HUMIN